MERQVQPGQLDQVLEQAQPGDVVLLQPGIHSTQAPIAIPRGGEKGKPLIIRGVPGAIVDGGRPPNPNDLQFPNKPNRTHQPQMGDWCFLSLFNLEYVVFEDLTIRRCWPMAIFTQNCRYITWRNCNVTGGTFAFFARDDFTKREESHHFLIEWCSWIQDDTPEHKLWLQYEWEDAHGGADGHNGLRYFNGGFFGSGDILGNVVIRNNQISDAYNGVVFWATKELKKKENETEMMRRNHHVFVHDNVFARIRDNPIEPEGHMYDLRVHHNTFFNCHGWFSLDSVAGGFWYFYGNKGYFDSRQGGSTSRMGKVFKFYSEDPYPNDPVYVFNNSWHLRCPVISGDADAPHQTQHLKFFGNAIEFCRPQDGGLCTGVDFIENFDFAQSDAQFDHDVCNQAQFPWAMHQVHQEVDGRAGGGPIFKDGRGGDFLLAPGSAATGAGHAAAISLPAGGDAPIAPENAGVMQREKAISVPELEDDDNAAFA
jgi:hypothetical protein